MPSSYTSRNRLLKQATGEGTNVWGDLQNSGDTDLTDVALDGVTSLTITGNVTLTSANASADQSRGRTLKLSGSVAATITIPALEKWYLVDNGSSADQIVNSAGGGSSVTIRAGELVPVYCDAANVKRLTHLSMEGQRLQNGADPVNPQDFSTKQYADNLAFTSNAGILPGQVGNAGKFLTTNGSVASWGAIPVATATDVRAGTENTKGASSSALASSAAFITLTDAATVAWDASLGYNATVTLGGNRIIGAPTHLQDGMTYTLNLVQDGTGNRVPTWNAIWDFGLAGTPILQTAASKTDKVVAQYNATRTKLEATFWKGA